MPVRGAVPIFRHDGGIPSDRSFSLDPPKAARPSFPSAFTGATRPGYIEPLHSGPPCRKAIGLV
jgi:hypothetical protein